MDGWKRWERLTGLVCLTPFHGLRAVSKPLIRLYDKQGLDRFHDTSRLIRLIRLGDLLRLGLPINSFRPFPLFPACW